MTCSCETCNAIRRWKSLGVSDGEIEALLDIEMDRDYYKSILDGDWPSSVELLTQALERAKQKAPQRGK